MALGALIDTGIVDTLVELPIVVSPQYIFNLLPLLPFQFFYKIFATNTGTYHPEVQKVPLLIDALPSSVERIFFQSTLQPTLCSCNLSTVFALHCSDYLPVSCYSRFLFVFFSLLSSSS